MTSHPAGWTATELAQAIMRGQLELHYQPIVDLRSDRIVGAEALLRWRHPTLGMLPPGQFLPVAESSGLMPEVGAWVLGAACRQMAEVSYEKREAVVTFDNAKTNVQALMKATANAGYPASVKE